MRRKNQCAKCASSNLLRIPPVPGEEPHIAIGRRGMHPLTISKFVCGDCGYIEQWVSSDDDLAKLRSEYADQSQE